MDIKFDPEKLEKLNNPERLKNLPPDEIWNIFRLKESAVLVDVGAGTAFFALIFAKKIKNGKIYACDNSEVMVEWMKNNITDQKIIPVKTLEDKINLQDEIADLVYMINVHHELVEPESILIEAKRILKHGGKIAVIDWKAEKTEQGPPLSIRISDETIINQLLKIGFTNIENCKILLQHNFIIAIK